jgi:anti-sigma-K factor RskA
MAAPKQQRCRSVRAQPQVEPEGKTYQIWVIKGDTPQPSGLFESKGDSVAAVVENPVEGADAVAVTIEPEGGSRKPTTDPMLVGKVKA